MNILMMSNTYYPITGGLEKSIQSFTQEFRRRGHKVLIVVPEFKKAKEEFGVVHVPSIQNFNGTDFSVSLPIPGLVEKLMETFKPNIIHAHHPFLMGDMAKRIAGQYGLPLVFTYHTMFEQYADFFPFLGTEAGKNFIMELAAGFSNFADHVIAPSESVRLILERRGIKTPISVVPTGVDTKLFKKGNGKAVRRKFKIPPKAFVLGYAGRLSPEKNLSFLAQSASFFLRENKNAYFLIVGDGHSKAEMKKIFSFCKVQKQIRFAGKLLGEELVSAYKAMDVFGFASQSETQGIVVTEAMAAGLPVVAIDAPGVREVVRDRVNGRLLEREDVKIFSDTLREIMEQPAGKHQKMKREALKTAEKFSMTRLAEKALRIYRKVRKKILLSGEPDAGSWELLMNRIRTEWDILANLGKAAGAVFIETTASSADSSEVKK